MQKVTLMRESTEIALGNGLMGDVKDYPILKKWIAALDVMCIDVGRPDSEAVKIQQCSVSG